MNWLQRLFFYPLTILLHPLLAINTLWLIFYSFNPYSFGGNNWSNTNFSTVTLRLFVGTTFLPALAIFLIRRLGLIENLNMKGVKERIVPLVIACLFYFWIYLNIGENGSFPAYFQQVVLGICLTLLFSFFTVVFTSINLFAASSISLILAFLIAATAPHRHQFFIEGQILIDSQWIIIAMVLLAGIYSSFRLLVNRSNLRETIIGYAAGIIGQILAVFVV
jgi:hypothetical protein